MTFCKGFLIAAVATALILPAAALLLPAAAFAATDTGKPTRPRIKVHPKRLWHGYGFLPGYRPSPAESQGLPIIGRDPRNRREVRYIDLYGNVRYGYGGPGFYRGRYNGGSFGPCWTYTPIGMMPTCGQ